MESLLYSLRLGTKWNKDSRKFIFQLLRNYGKKALKSERGKDLYTENYKTLMKESEEDKQM